MDGYRLHVGSPFAQFLDGVACRLAGHVWLQQTAGEPEGVKVCVRCGARDDSEARRVGRGIRAGRRRRAPAVELLPEDDRPWLDPPYRAREF